ncbi:hypothetical protein TeGR_g2946 [Tetraparma gracilis]|uniref:Cytochrome b561 domain-containing protein n=1 Tax=Tetraparma gracilis TaxID=2962635 RepID=A0ABQ6MR75_9STRA|nr:hypothetical protein TeGR_g2946 [Tetraparma gracilis]
MESQGAGEDPKFYLDEVEQEDGPCALSQWDSYESELADALEHNAILANATAVKEEGPGFPWRELAIPAHLLIMFLLLWLGDRLSVKKAVVSASAVAPEPEGDVARMPSKVADTFTFRRFHGLTGVFVACSLIAVGVLAFLLGSKVENDDNVAMRVVQSVCFNMLGLLAFGYTHARCNPFHEPGVGSWGLDDFVGGEEVVERGEGKVRYLPRFRRAVDGLVGDFNKALEEGE